MFEYNSRVRRVMRVASRVAGYQFSGDLRPRCTVVDTWWRSKDPNFGDLLTPFILPRYGIVPVLRAPDDVELAGVGSILGVLPEDFTGVIWGTGSFGDEVTLPMGAKVLALRGRLTWEKMGRPEGVAFGDPGLLMRELVPASEKKWKLGVAAHITHRDRSLMKRLRAIEGVKDIDVTQSPRHVARQISACEAVVTTSLHGLIVADSYGIPAAWAMLEPVVGGAEFKFLDHESAVVPERDRQTTLDGTETLDELRDRTALASPDEVSRRIAELEQSLVVLRKSVGREVRPWSLGAAHLPDIRRRLQRRR